MKMRSAAALPVWGLVGMSGLAATVSSTAVQGSRTGCIDNGVADLVSIGGIAGFGLAVSALLLVATVPRYRTLPRAAGALAALSLSLYAVVTFLAQDGATCAF